MTFQAWKMVFLNSMTFHDQEAPWFVVHANKLKKCHVLVGIRAWEWWHRRSGGIHH